MVIFQILVNNLSIITNPNVQPVNGLFWIFSSIFFTFVYPWYSIQFFIVYLFYFDFPIFVLNFSSIIQTYWGDILQSCI